MVALRVLRRVRVVTVLLAGNVGRQRNVAVALHERVGIVPHIVGQHEAKQGPLRIGPTPQQRGPQSVRMAGRAVQRDGFANGRLFAHPQVRGYLVAAQHTLHQQLQLAAGGFFTKQAGLQDFGVVEHQQIARTQQGGQIAKDAVYGMAATGVKEACAGALGCGVLGDQLRGQRKVKIAQRIRRRHGA